MTCHLINRAVMEQSCVEALNQHAQTLEKKAAFSNFTETSAISRPCKITQPETKLLNN